MSTPAGRTEPTPNAMAAGAALYILVERSHLLRFASSHDKTGGAPETD